MLTGLVGLVEFVGFQFTVVSSSGICELGFRVSLMFLCGVSSLSLSSIYVIQPSMHAYIHISVWVRVCVSVRSI